MKQSHKLCFAKLSAILNYISVHNSSNLELPKVKFSSSKNGLREPQKSLKARPKKVSIESRKTLCLQN